MGKSPNQNSLFENKLPINWHGITLTGTMAYECFCQGNFIDLNTFDCNAWLYMTDGFCRIEGVIIKDMLQIGYYRNCLNFEGFKFSVELT